MFVNLVVDVQNGFVNEGPLKVPQADTVAKNIIQYVKECRASGELIFATVDTHDEKTYSETIEGQRLPLHCAEGTEEHKLVQGLVKDENGCVIIPQGHIVDKSTFSSCQIARRIELALMRLDEPVDAIKIYGFVTSICVLNNALMLRNHFPCTKIQIVAPLCRDIGPDLESAALKVAKANLIDIVDCQGNPV